VGDSGKILTPEGHQGTWESVSPRLVAFHLLFLLLERVVLFDETWQSLDGEKKRGI
jgi:hypothetical protein